MQWIYLSDYLLVPFYLVAVYIIAYRFRDRAYPPGHAWRPYFIPGLTVKIVGAVFISFIYQYYYGAGDTMFYFEQSKVVNSAFAESPVKWLNLIFHIPAAYDGAYMEYTSKIIWYTTLNNYMVVIVSAIIGIFTFNSYLPTSVLFAALSFTGIWALFRTFAKVYPVLVRPIALVLLFIPSTFIWGSGIFKDTICMFGMGWMISGVFTLLIQRKLQKLELVMMCLGAYLIAVIKIYILLAFIPAIGLWLVFTYSGKLKSGLIRLFLKLSLGALTAVGFYVFSSNFAEDLGQYSFENIERTATVTQTYIYQSSGDQGSRYSIGTLDFTPAGLLKSFPLAVNVTLFRPYIWESRKPIVLFNALEASIFLLITLKLLLRLGPVKIWRAISSDPNIQFCLIFTIIFAFAVGLTSGTFGTLSRYRIPCLPLYGFALVLIYYRYNPPDKKFLSVK